MAGSSSPCCASDTASHSRPASRQQASGLGLQVHFESCDFLSSITARSDLTDTRVVGRFTLGFITPRIGEKLAVSIYLVLAMALELIFWLVPQFIVSAVAVALVGFFLGPLFPAAIIAVTKILPPKLHVPAIGISASIGGGGAALLPFAVGAVAQAAGVQTLQPIVLGLIGVLFCIWMTLPRIPKHAHTE